ncbi:MAG TPA: BsuPI-related putative proteinase inhibitor [bacterium]|jgi:hypothetical protein
MLKKTFTILVITLLSASIIAFLSGCPNSSGNGDEEDASGSDTEASVATEESARDTMETADEDANGSSDRVPAVTDDRVRTAEEPLMDPARPADGVEEVPMDTVVLLADLVSGDNVIPLKDDMTIAASETLKVRFSLVNNTDEVKTYVFPTGQKTEIYCLDDSGNEVYRWSAGLRFSQPLNTLEVQPHDTWSHEITVNVGDGDFMLAYGTYKIVAELVGTPTVSATASGVSIAPPA